MFRWATDFLERVANVYGKDRVKQKLAEWKVDVTTCFSGIGCAETVANPANVYSHCFNI